MKVYIRYLRPDKGGDDEPPIDEVWDHGDRPAKRFANDGLTFVYDVKPGTNDLINEREWDGNE